MLLLASFVAAHYLEDDPGPVLPVLAVLSGNDKEALDDIRRKAETWAIPFSRLSGSAFVIAHEETHIDGPNRGRADADGETPLSSEETELFCDMGACFRMLNARSRWFGKVGFEEALTIAVALISFLTAARLLSQSRVQRTDVPRPPGYPSFDERIAVVIQCWVEWISKLGYSDKIDSSRTYFSNTIRKLICKLQEEIDLMCSDKMSLISALSEADIREALKEGDKGGGPVDWSSVLNVADSGGVTDVMALLDRQVEGSNSDGFTPGDVGAFCFARMTRSIRTCVLR
jgi:hypothetical protein